MLAPLKLKGMVEMSYEPSVGSVLVEASACLAFLRCCVGAWAAGRRWLASLCWAALAGFGAEVALVHISNARYEYAVEKFYWSAFDVPVCMGLGWAVVFHASAWTAQRLGLRSALLSAWAAGVLAASLDLALDPAAVLHGLWRWRRALANPHASLLGVPFDNFIGWILLTGVYAGWVRWLFRWRNQRVFRGVEPRTPGFAALAAPASERWFDALLPLLAAVQAALSFVVVRAPGEALYALALRSGGALALAAGEGVVFALLFVPGWLLLWRALLRGPRSAEPSWSALGGALYLHGLSLLLALLAATGAAANSGDVVTALVVLPLVAMLSTLAFGWRSLDRLVQRPHEADSPGVQTRLLRSYSGQRVVARVCTPGSVPALRAALEHARREGWTVTFRAGGFAFDGQALNRELVIFLTELRHIRVDAEAGCVDVGAGATWGEILKATLPHGLVPFVMVTGSGATAGGTLSSHSVSRFTPSVGREGRHVEWLRLLTPAGEIVSCSRSEEPELFRAVIGGFGYVGAVLEIRYRLLRVPRGARVHTVFTRLEGMALVTGSLAPPAGSSAPLALSVALNGGGPIWGLHARSEYVAPRPLARSPFHHPSSLGHLILQVAALFPVLRSLAYRLIARFWPANAPREFVDDAFGYTFFEDGNVRLRRLLAAIGCRPRALQQAFVLPRRGAGAGTATIEGFIAEARALLDERGLVPAMFDVLHIPADDQPFLLSSSNGLDGFCATLTFTALFGELRREREVLATLAQVCERHGGRVHLVKNVCAEPGLIERMYAPALAALAHVRRRTGAAGFVQNDFAARVLTTLDGGVEATASRANRPRGDEHLSARFRDGSGVQRAQAVRGMGPPK